MNGRRQIFVFGSNLAGRHGKGAAKFAFEHWGARYGQGEGLQGASYGIPTKDERLKILPLAEIEKHVERFLDFARAHQLMEFQLTAIGTGLAGYDAKDIAPMFRDAPDNVRMPVEFENLGADSKRSDSDE